MGKLAFTRLKKSKTDSKAHKMGGLIFSVLIALSAYKVDADLLGLPPLTFKGFIGGGLRSGLVFTWNCICDTLARADFVILQKYDGAAEGNGTIQIIIIAVMILSAFMAIKSGRASTLLIFALPAALLMIFFSLSCKPLYIVIFISVLIASASYIRGSEENAAGSLAWGIMFAAAVMLIISIPSYDQYKGNFKELNDFAASVRESVSKTIYGENPLKEGDFKAPKRGDADKSRAEETALTVNMSNPQSMYLRGFTGSIFTGAKWETLDNNTYYQNLSLMDGLERDGFKTSGQLAQSSELAGVPSATTSNEISIHVESANRRLAYIPYDIADKGELSEYIFKGGDIPHAGMLGAFKSYSYVAKENQVDNWTETASKLFSEADPEKTKEYLKDESYYNVFVYQNYLFLSKHDQSIIGEVLGDRGNQSKGHVGYKAAIEKIRRYFNDNYIYTERPGERKAELTGDPLKKFLSSGKGYDVQFATAAVLMFRYYGIPARYAEGYIVTPDDVTAKAPDESIVIKRKNAHAWPEIYIDGVGFVPIEVCRNYIEIMGEADMNIGISNKILWNDFEASQDNANAEGESSKDAPQSRHNIVNKIRLILLILAAMALMIPFGKRTIVYCRDTAARNKAFRSKDTRFAVCAIFAYMEQRGFDIEPDVRECGNRAAYSRYGIGEGDRSKMLDALTRYKEASRRTRNGKGKR